LAHCAWFPVLPYGVLNLPRIFESGGDEDCLRLLVGHLPKSTTGPAIQSLPATLPLSPHYARLLAELAYLRGFDGYLLNFECPLLGGIEQTRTLAAWIRLLQSELEAKVGSHAQSIWYDSVIFNGQLRWQDRLNSLNLPFFLSSTGLFTNYTVSARNIV
jgi:mannosyl-glycoprotein endo-beta-N-acetylglucosaminidase